MVPAGLVLALASCTEQDASGFERAVDSFFISILEFFLMMMLLAAFMFVLWALIFAGAATAVIAGIRRLTAGRRDDPSALDAQPSAPPPPPPASPNREPDWLGVGMIVFGVVLLLAAAPTVFSVSLGPTSGGAITIPLPLILGGAGLVWLANRRRRDQEAARAAELRAQQERSEVLPESER